MNITLIFPPHWSPYQPYLSIPSLTAYLRQHGYRVTQRDINIEFIDYITSTKGLKESYKRIENKVKILKDKKELTGEEECELSRLTLWEGSHQTLIRSIKGAKSLLKDHRNFFNISLFRNSSIVFSRAYQMAGDSYYPAYMDFYYIGQKYSPNSTEEILKAIEDRKINMYIDYFEKFTIPSFKKEPADFYGISVTDFTQVIPGITLARLIKKNFPGTHICMGGNVFTRVGKKLIPSSPLFKFFDSIILFEGEIGLLKLIKTLESKGDFSNIPGIIYKNKEGLAVLNEKLEYPDINSLPAPDFDGLPLDKYLSPVPVLSLLASRGCYWNKCTFCQHKYNYQGGYRPRETEKVIEDIKLLMEKYRCRNFTINDEAIPPGGLKKIADKILEENLDICWEAHSRGEKSFDKDLAELLYKSGCRMLSFGLESASQRLLKLMCKGIDVKVLEKILGYTSEAGIWNHVWFFTGFPTETEEEARNTVDFILKNQDKIHSVPFNVSFGLEGDTDIIKNPSKYKIKEIKSTGKNDLSFVYEYTVTEGLSMEDAEKLTKELEIKLLESHRYSFINYIMTTVHKMLYVDHFGTNNLTAMTREVTTNSHDHSGHN